MGSENPTGADNQQETVVPPLELDPSWIAGFVDGEGCFCISIHRNPRYAKRSFGWQLHPCFQVYQHERHRAVLEGLQATLACGRIRPKGPRSSVLTYAVDALRDIRGSVIPFFERHALVVKQRDFRIFVDIVDGIGRGEHFTPAGFERLVRLAYAMNFAGKQRARPMEEVLGILRDCTPGLTSRE